MKRHFIILLSTTSLLWTAEPLVITKDSATTFYQGFKRLTAEPRFVSPTISALCGTATIPKRVFDKERAINGPHAGVAVHIYANPPAADSIAANAAEFPVGAVIVKENLLVLAGPVPGLLGRPASAGIGGMVKRPKGYDPANGDWEFFFYSAEGQFSTGKLANCIDCHNGGKRDHVFSVRSLQSK